MKFFINLLFISAIVSALLFVYNFVKYYVNIKNVVKHLRHLGVYPSLFSIFRFKKFEHSYLKELEHNEELSREVDSVRGNVTMINAMFLVFFISLILIIAGMYVNLL